MDENVYRPANFIIIPDPLTIRSSRCGEIILLY
jgi:hypothetical protein